MPTPFWLIKICSIIGIIRTLIVRQFNNFWGRNNVSHRRVLFCIEGTLSQISVPSLCIQQLNLTLIGADFIARDSNDMYWTNTWNFIGILRRTSCNSRNASNHIETFPTVFSIFIPFIRRECGCWMTTVLKKERVQFA